MDLQLTSSLLLHTVLQALVLQAGSCQQWGSAPRPGGLQAHWAHGDGTSEWPSGSLLSAARLLDLSLHIIELI